MHDARSVYTVDRGHPQNVIFQQPARVVDFFHSFRIDRFSPVFSGFIPVRYIFSTHKTTDSTQVFHTVDNTCGYWC